MIFEAADGTEQVIVLCGPPEREAEEPCEAGIYTSGPITLDAGT